MKNRKGVTLSELIIAMVMIMIAALVALTFLIHCKRLAVQPKLRGMAVNFAAETMESLYWLYDLAAATNVSDPLPNTGNFSLLSSTYGGTRDYTVRPVSDPSYTVIEVRVQWN